MGDPAMPKYFQFTNGDKLPVGIFYGIGRNYEAHAREMGGVVTGKTIVFIKPPSAYIEDGEMILLPRFSKLVHHEVELVVVIGKECSNVSADKAEDYIAGYAVGVDVTLRDVQNKARLNGNPWTVAKGFATSAPVSMIVPASELGKSPEFGIELRINGELRQQGNTHDMIRSAPELIEYLSSVFTLQPGDAIFTGTPEGVGPIVCGDQVHAELKGYIALDVTAKECDHNPESDPESLGQNLGSRPQ
jgi:2-keto-4-pentenoate hydratase/2-oxohepta-3-ene-1,7-dioic acid hydratase in catechol pathway